MQLAQARIGDVMTVQHVGGERAFRRRLMELGLVPGTRVELVSVAPLGDPVELLVRGASLSIRRAEAACVRVVAVDAAPLSDLVDVASRSGVELATDCASSSP
ncbi:MAG: ferrous iron transport protein A [Myxococcales bacterium]|nr:ferrous iron transport protein A [Myxococcales bacterium]MCB9576264.1 ferrous iron transport protein A [Polyangiaceae bacterium]